MRLRMTFSGYIGKQFLLTSAGVFLTLVALIALFDLIELLRRTAGEESVSIIQVAAMTMFKLPHLSMKALPFALLFGGMMAFWRLNRHHELVVARASGLSAWDLLMPAILTAVIVGVIKVTLFSPLASAMLLRFERWEAALIEGKPSLAALSGGGLWLRQSTAEGHYVLHARAIRTEKMELADVIVFNFEGTDRFVGRIDAKGAVLENGTWLLHNGQLSTTDGRFEKIDRMRIVTDLTRENIQDSFATPETLSFWALPGFIEVLENAGFSGLRHRLYWYAQIADPLLLAAMVMLAAVFTLRPTRRGGGLAVLGLGVGTGFLVYFASDVVYALGLSARLPVMLSAWSPAVVGCLIGSALLFHLEDG
jgi:lipopolysaccharide export system permease protein